MRNREGNKSKRCMEHERQVLQTTFFEKEEEKVWLILFPSSTWSSSLNMNKSDTDKPRRIEHKRGNKREWNKLRMMFFLDSCKNNPLHNPDDVEQPNALKRKAHIYQEEIHILEARWFMNYLFFLPQRHLYENGYSEGLLQ